MFRPNMQPKQVALLLLHQRIVVLTDCNILLHKPYTVSS